MGVKETRPMGVGATWRAGDKKVVSQSGASQSEVAERYDLMCPAALRRLAGRYAMGAAKHSPYNYCLGGKDHQFQRDRINHAIKHLVLYLERGNFDRDGNFDDNLAAAMWGIATTIHFEEGCQHHLAPIPGNAYDLEPDKFVRPDVDEKRGESK